MKLHRALAPLAVLALSLGCAVERTYDGMDLNPDRFAIPANFANVAEDGVRPLAAHLAGDVGPGMRGFDDNAQIIGYHERGYTNLEVGVSNDRGAAMALLDISGGINHPAFQPGASLTFASDGSTSAADDLFITGVACSTDQPNAYGQWNYDAPLQQVDVDVEGTDNPEVRRLNFTTIHADGDSATGHVDVVVPN